LLIKKTLVCSLLLSMTACQSAGTSETPSVADQTSATSTASEMPLSQSAIRHVVIIVQENRTVDNLFHGFPGADTANYGMNSSGHKVPLRPEPLDGGLELPHQHSVFLVEYALGKMNGFNLITTKCNAHTPPSQCPKPSVAAYSYVPQGDVRPYWQMAQTYAFGDEMFQSNEGPSFPAHQYIVSGTSAISNKSQLKAAGNPSHRSRGKTGGCGAGPDDKVVLINQYGIEDHVARPCFVRISLMELLDDAGLTWRYYGYTSKPSIWNGPNAVEPIWNSPVYATSDVHPPSRILRDIAKGDLAAVSWVTPTRKESDHPGSNDGSGPSWVASVVNAIGNSPYWGSTAIFVTWDDWGGWYDHVRPHIYNSYELGLRVPLIVISPYAKRGYVSHVQHEFGSILKFTEEVFGLPSLGTTDVRSDDLSDCFDFTSHALPFTTIAAPLTANYFLNANDTSDPPDDY
jgi:phospholipase C